MNRRAWRRVLFLHVAAGLVLATAEPVMARATEAPAGRYLVAGDIDLRVQGGTP